MTESIVCGALATILALGAPFGSVYADLTTPGAYTASQSVGEALQLPDYPAGCEPMSLCILLEAYEYDATMPGIMLYFERSETDFVNAYWGSEYSEGAAYPPAVVEAANRYLLNRGSKMEAVDLTGVPWEAVEWLMDEGQPVMAWVTVGYHWPIWSEWKVEGRPMYANEHCVVLYGLEDGKAKVSDPLEGMIEVDAEQFRDVWERCGRMAVYLDSKGE